MRKALAVFVSALVAVLAIPATTAQATPACGTTPEQWAGVFDGPFLGSPGGTLHHTITVTDGVMAVETLVNGRLRNPAYGTPVLTGDTLTWAHADTTPRGQGASSVYTTTSVSCTGGVVQSFTGVEEWTFKIVFKVIAEVDTPFTAARA